MPDIDTEELGRLTREATPGPWKADPGTPDWGSPEVIVDEGIPIGAGHMSIAEMGQSEEQGMRNADLIVAMRNALPWLLAALHAKDREIAALKEAVAWYSDSDEGELTYDPDDGGWWTGGAEPRRAPDEVLAAFGIDTLEASEADRG